MAERIIPCESAEDLPWDMPGDVDNAMILGAMYANGVKPGQDNGTPAEKKAYADYYAKRQAGATAEELLFKWYYGNDEV